MRFRINITFSSIAIVIFSGGVHVVSQELSGFSGAFAQLHVPARSAGLGELQGVSTSPGEALYTNPAALIAETQRHVAFHYFRLFHVLPYLTSSYTQSRSLKEGYGVSLTTSGDALYRESMFSGAYARKYFLPRYSIDAGATGRLYYGGFGQNANAHGAITGTVWGFGLDLGARLWISKQAMIGVVFRNGLNQLFWSTSGAGDYTEGMARQLIVGAGLHDAGNYTAGFDWEAGLYAEVADRFHFGIEKTCFHLIDLRFGYRWSLGGLEDDQTSFGIGFSHEILENHRLSVDIAYSVSNLPNTLRFSCGWRL